jgi:hypothetical protein
MNIIEIKYGEPYPKEIRESPNSFIIRQFREVRLIKTENDKIEIWKTEVSLSAPNDETYILGLFVHNKHLFEKLK